MVPFIGLLSFVAFIIGIIATIKGNMPSLGIKSRKVAAIVMVVSLILLITMLEADDSPNASDNAKMQTPEPEQIISTADIDSEKEEENEVVKELEKFLDFEGRMELKVDENNVIMNIFSNVPDGGVFEVVIMNNNFDVLSDFIEITDKKIVKAFEIPKDWEIGYISGMAMFRFNLDDHPQPDHIEEIYGKKGEKMLGEQALETFDGGYTGNIEPITIAYPDEATIQKKINELFTSSMQDLIKSSNGIIKRIEPDGSWGIVLVTLSDSWYLSMDYEKERFAETVGSLVETLVKNAGKVDKDKSVNVYFYDTYGKELASPKVFGGYKIKR